MPPARVLPTTRHPPDQLSGVKPPSVASAESWIDAESAFAQKEFAEP